MAGQRVVYLKCNRNVESKTQAVFMNAIGTVHCADPVVQAKCQAIKVHQFTEKGPKRCVVSALRLVALMEGVCPGISVEIVGETDVLIELISVGTYKGWQEYLKILIVCLVSFFGTGFTIMAYHNDIGINAVFTQIYKMIMNREPAGINVLEISYSIGLALGILYFFNHIGSLRLTKDPTPLEVAMRNYEKDVDQALIETAARENQEAE